MKKLLLIGFIASFINVQAQDTTSTQKRVSKGFGVSIVQVQPEFPGGEDSLHSFLKDNLNYPDSARINHVQGRVYVGFKVDRTGKIINPIILSSASRMLEDEAIRVVKMMPDWKPGTAGGSPVDIQYILPIDFLTPPRHPSDK